MINLYSSGKILRNLEILLSENVIIQEFYITLDDI